MAGDPDTGDLYWMAYANPYAPLNGTEEPDGPATFFKVDKATGKLTVVSDVEYDSWMTALFKPYTESKDILPAAELEAINLDKTSVSMGTGATASLLVTPYPYFATMGEITYTGSEEQWNEIQIGSGNEAVEEKVVISSVLMGDVTGDGKVNVGDAVKLLKAIASKTTGEFSEDVFTAADVTRDGKLNVGDAVKLLKAIASKTTDEL